MMNLKDKSLFHVHTWRCGHAEQVSDEEYIKAGISKGASDIWFTDHAPFPGDYFTGRMKMNQLNDYLDSLISLKEYYKSEINIHVGLEIEYLDSFVDYIKELHKNPCIECLILGQHMYELEDGTFSFENKNKSVRERTIQFINSTIKGIDSGLYAVVAHPDRVFRFEKYWDDELSYLSKDLIRSAKTTGVLLEQNLSSMKSQNYKPQFWSFVDPSVKIIRGLDAHCVDDLFYDDISWFRKQTGMTQQQFSAFFSIPLSTIQDWEHKRRTPPCYVLDMMRMTYSSAITK